MEVSPKRDLAAAIGKRAAFDVIVPGDAKRQMGRRIQVMARGFNAIHHCRHVPPGAKPRTDHLAGLRGSCRLNRFRLRLSPLIVVSGHGEQIPHSLDRSVNYGDGAYTDLHIISGRHLDTKVFAHLRGRDR